MIPDKQNKAKNVIANIFLLFTAAALHNHLPVLNDCTIRTIIMVA
jgi:hypothetical protein